MSKRIVSVIIPTYKRNRILERAIQSVLNQSFDDFEIIVVDDNGETSEYRKLNENLMKNFQNNDKIIYLKHKTNLNAAVAPTSGSGYYTFNANGNAGKPSHSGMYQKLELIKGVEYQIELRTPINPNTGTVTVNTYTPFEDTFILTSTVSITYPVIRSHVGLVTSLFTAGSGRDVIVIYFQTTATSSTDATITNISIKEKQDYLTPIYAEDRWGNDHKVLRRNLDNPTFNT